MPRGDCHSVPEGEPLNPFIAWDVWWYRGIVTRGYGFSPDRPSSVAFFPAYPLCGRVAAEVGGESADAALVLTSQVCCAASFVVL